MIDFGLSFNSLNAEDKAVDLYVLERAFVSTHTEMAEHFKLLIEEYKKASANGQKTLEQLERVQKRGRKRLAFG